MICYWHFDGETAWTDVIIAKCNLIVCQKENKKYDILMEMCDIKENKIFEGKYVILCIL